MNFGEKLFQAKLLSRLSHKVCRLLSSPVLLRKFTIVDDDAISSQFVQAFGASSAMSKFLSVLTLVL